MENRKLINFTSLISIMWLIVSAMELTVFFGYKSLDNISLYITTLLFSFIAPVYFIILSRYYRKNKIQKLSLKKSVKIIIFTLILEFIITLILGSISSLFTAGSENANIKDLEFNSVSTFIIVAGTLLWDLAGEEGGKIAFFLFLERILPKSLFKNNNKLKYWICWLIDVLFFGILHLSAYSYDMVQCILVIGLPSIIYGYLWQKTENPKALWIVHFLYDFTLVGLVVIGDLIG